MGDQRIKRLEENIRNHLVKWLLLAPLKGIWKYIWVFFIVTEWKRLYWPLVGVGEAEMIDILPMFRMAQDNEELSFPVPDQVIHHLILESFLCCGLTIRRMNRKFSFRITAMQF